MKYDIILFNADHGNHRYLCRIHRCNDAPIFETKEDAKFADETELRKKFNGILIAREIERAVTTLQSHHLQEVRFKNVEITDQQLMLIGWHKTMRM